MPKRPCLDCGTLASGSRCTRCKSAKDRQRDAQRGTTTERGLGWEYQQLRAEILASGPPCHWGCGRQATTTDHLIPRTRGGTTTRDNLVPACKPCNDSRGDRDKPSARITLG